MNEEDAVFGTPPLRNTYRTWLGLEAARSIAADHWSVVRTPSNPPEVEQALLAFREGTIPHTSNSILEEMENGFKRSAG